MSPILEYHCPVCGDTFPVITLDPKPVKISCPRCGAKDLTPENSDPTSTGAPCEPD